MILFGIIHLVAFVKMSYFIVIHPRHTDKRLREMTELLAEIRLRSVGKGDCNRSVAGVLTIVAARPAVLP